MAYNRYKKFTANKHLGNLKPPFCEFNAHDYEAPVMRSENMLITSIDPGIVNSTDFWKIERQQNGGKADSDDDTDEDEDWDYE